MVHPVETEIKLTATPVMLEKLRLHPQLAGHDHTATLVSRYFDTVDGKLRRAGAALRIRDGGNGREQTLKLGSTAGPSVQRMEWNVAVAGDLPVVSGFPAKARSALARIVDGAPLELFATTRIERTTRRLRYASSTIEIAFDVGTIHAGGREDGIGELELELIEGHLSDVLALALQLPLGPELNWSVSSKADRCHALAFDLQHAKVPARPVTLAPTVDRAHGFQAIAWHCLDQLLAHYPLVIASGSPEGVHQARVAIRQVRSALNLFDDVIDDEVAAVLSAELKAVAVGLGPARDIHVLHERVAAAARTSDDDLSELLAQLAFRRDAAVRSAQTLLADEPFQRLLFEFAAWVEAGPWLTHVRETGANLSLVPFASRILSRGRRKLRRVGDRLSDLPDSVRHRLRIDVKKLRYAADFFASLYRGKAVARQQLSFAKSLGRLQDSLGELNDMAVAAEGWEALFTEVEPITAAGLSARLERLLASQAKSRRKLLKAAERSLAEIDEAPAWWKAD